MNNLTSFQRKIAYALGIVILLVPIIVLGRPATRDEQGLHKGGVLAQLRDDYDLGEASLGNIDPSSSTMNLVLLGFRGIATNLLWQNAMEQKDQKQWAQLRSTVDSIIMLQPHFIKVWDFQGWNLAYNVSAEWDNVDDRYYWVKEGGKFYMTGTDRNLQNPDLVFKTGTVLSHKIGRSDEWDQFRGFFNADPDDERFEGGPDPAFNRGYDDGSFDDNYMAARDWFLEANTREKEYGPQHVMMRELFLSYPAHSYMEMANVRHREGKFDDVTRQAWQNGHEAWTEEYGQEEFPSRVGPVQLEIAEEKAFAEIAAANSKLLKRTVTAAEVKNQINFLQNTVNYRYWRTRSAAEAMTNTAEAHREIYDGQQLFEQGKLDQSEAKILSGLKKLEILFDDFPNFEEDDLAVEETLTAMIYLRAIKNIYEKPVPTDLPLMRLWNADNPRLPDLLTQFRLQTGYTPTEEGQPAEEAPSTDKGQPAETEPEPAEEPQPAGDEKP